MAMAWAQGSHRWRRLRWWSTARSAWAPGALRAPCASEAFDTFLGLVWTIWVVTRYIYIYTYYMIIYIYMLGCKLLGFGLDHLGGRYMKFGLSVANSLR